MATSNKKKLRKLFESENFNTNTEIEDITSRFIPDNEELILRDFIKKYENERKISGSFTRCANLGLITGYDLERKNSLFKYSISFFIQMQLFAFVSLNFLKKSKILKTEKPFGVFLIGSIFFSSLVIGMRYYLLYSELDEKYSPVWNKMKVNMSK